MRKSVYMRFDAKSEFNCQLKSLYPLKDSGVYVYHDCDCNVTKAVL